MITRWAAIVVADGAAGTRLVDFARAQLAGVAAGAVGPLIARGALTVGDRVGRIDDALAAGDVIAVDLAALAPGDRLVPEAVPLAIAYEDDDLVVVDKPAGLHVHPLGPYRTGTLVNALLAHAGAHGDSPWAAWRPHTVHRLDRAASGLVLVAKRAAVHEALRPALEAHAIERRYEATVHGRVAADEGTIDAPLGRDPARDYRRAVRPDGQPAVSHYRVLARTTTTTHLALTLATGRTHQLRAHTAHLGHPIVGDTLYGSPAATGPAIALRAVTLTLAHPRDGRPLRITAGPPELHSNPSRA